MGRLDNLLRDDLLAVFERACREDDFEVAEYLLQALEAIARRDDAGETMQHVYIDLARMLRKE